MINSRWFILAVLFVARVALGYQFQSAGSLAPFLIRDFNIDYMQIGVLVGGFILPGLAVSIPSGFLGHRFGDKTIVLWGMGLMTAGGIVAGIADSYSTILFGRVLSGIGGSSLIVLMSKMVTDWFARKELFLGNAICIVGWPIGIAVAQATQSRLAELQSWRGVFISSSVLVMSAFVLMMVFYHRPPCDTPPLRTEPATPTQSEVRMACLAGIIWMFLNGAYLVMLSFGPAHLIERGMSIAEASSVVSLMSWVFIFALPLGGYIATRYDAPNVVVLVGLIASIVLSALIPFAPAPLLTFALVGTSLAFATPVLGSLPAEILALNARGPGFGVYYLWYFGGMPALLALAGLLRDRTGSATASMIFATSMMLYCLLLLGLFRLAQTRQRDPQRG